MKIIFRFESFSHDFGSFFKEKIFSKIFFSSFGTLMLAHPCCYSLKCNKSQGESATRKWQLGERDTDYDMAHYNSFLTAAEATASEAAKAQRKASREKRLQERRHKEQEDREERQAVMEPSQNDNEDKEDENDNDDEIDDECEEGKQRKRKRSESMKNLRRGRMTRSGGGGESDDDEEEEEEGVWAFIPKEILKKTAPTAIRKALSHGDHVSITAAFLRSCTGEDGAPLDLDKFPISYSTSYRKRKEVMKNTYDETRAEFRDRAIDENWLLFLHGDDKELSDTIGPRGAGVKNKVERQVVILTSPMFEGEQFVSAHAIEDATGRAQAEGAVESVRDLGVLHLVVGIDGDTTPSVTSPTVGMMARIEEERGAGEYICGRQ